MIELPPPASACATRTTARLVLTLCLFLMSACERGPATSGAARPVKVPDSGVSPLPKPKATLYKELTHPKMKSCSRIARSPNGDVVVTDPRGGAVHIFSGGGAWKKTISGIGRPLGCAVDKVTRIYVGDAATASVLVYSAAGSYMHRLNKPTVKLQMPNELTADRVHGEIFVSDSKAHRVVVFNTSGVVLRTITGSGKSKLAFPTGLFYDVKTDRLLIGDHDNSRVQIFQRKGTLIGSFGAFGDQPGEFVRIQGLTLDATGRLFVVDVHQGRIMVADTNGGWINKIGTRGLTKGTLALPTDALFDGSGRLWVTSFRTAKVVIYTLTNILTPDQGVTPPDLPPPATPDLPTAPDQAVPTPDQAAPDTAPDPVIPDQAATPDMPRPDRAAVDRSAELTAPDMAPPDRGVESSPGEGCDCSVDRGPGPLGLLVFLPGLLWARVRRRRSRRGRLALGAILLVTVAAVVVHAIDKPHDKTQMPAGCQSCHVSHTKPTTHQQVQNLCLGCHYENGPATPVSTHACAKGKDGCDNTFDITCTTCHNPHLQEQKKNGSTHGKYIRAAVKTSSSGTRPVVLMGPTGNKSFADDDATMDGICEVCHTKTKHHTNDPKKKDADHYAGIRCTACHRHENGFRPTGAASGSHSIHVNKKDPRGPGLDCSDCHDAKALPAFKIGVDANGDGKYSLAETTVCDACHSPKGSFNGVKSVNGSVGAKDVWKAGVYEKGKLKAGMGRWCAGCHDENPSTIKSVAAPNVVGGQSVTTSYGSGYGYYKSGHGLPVTSSYPASGGTVPGAGLACVACHDTSLPHLDGKARTYQYKAAKGAANDYRHGYRLALVGGKEPLAVPRQNGCFTGVNAGDFRLCLRCHGSGPFLSASNKKTNFRRDGGKNAHYYHLSIAYKCGPGPSYTSDWRSHGNDSQATCVTCHNVHGSTQLSMVRDGRLVGRKPGLQVAYYRPGVTYQCGGPWAHYPKPGNVPLPKSTGTVWRATTQPLCRGCHGGCGFNSLYKRKAVDVSPPFIIGVHGRVGYNKLVVTLSEGAHATAGGTGGLTPADFVLTDTDNYRSVVLVSHKAGDRVATLTLSSNLDGAADLGVDTLAAKAASIFDAAGNAAMVATRTLAGDTTPPATGKQYPSSNATGVYTGSKVSLTLADGGCGVARSSLTVKLTGSKGYARSYTGASAAVAFSGTSASYGVTVTPSPPFTKGETITVKVGASDLLGNPMTPVTWSFSTAP